MAAIHQCFLVESLVEALASVFVVVVGDEDVGIGVVEGLEVVGSVHERRTWTGSSLPPQLPMAWVSLKSCDSLPTVR